MAHILAHDPARELPLYIAGFHAGRDVGLMVALNMILAEQSREDGAAILTRLDDPHGHRARVHAYAAGRLLAVGQRVAGAFRGAR